MKLVAAMIALCANFLGQVAVADTPGNRSNPIGGGLFETGEQLATLCDGKIGSDSPSTFAGGTCLGYIFGVAEIDLLNNVICYNNVTKGELSDTVVAYMNQHPDEVRRHPAIVLVSIALRAKYPVTQDCRKQIGAPNP